MTPTSSADTDWVRSPVTWIFVVLCVSGCTVLTRNYATAALGFAAAGVLATVILILTASIGGWILSSIRPFTNVSLGRALACLIWGITAATGFSILANSGLSAVWARAVSMWFADKWGDSITAPIDEETLKMAGLALLTLIVTPWIRGPMDGFVYGALIGQGFQAMENWTYAINAIFTNGGTDPIGSVLQSTFTRVVLTGLGSHWAMSAVAGAGLGFLLTRRRSPVRVAVGVALILLALTMHWNFNSPLLASGYWPILKMLVNFTVAAAVFLWLRRGVRHAALAQGADGTLLSRRGRRQVVAGQLPVTRQQLGAWIHAVEDRAYSAT
jgi:protease PrsW